MTNGEIVRYIVSLIFSVNGELENNLRNALGNYSSKTQDEAMKLYIYYKAGVMDQIVANISSSSDQRDAFSSLLLQEYNEYINNNNQTGLNLDMNDMMFFMRRFVSAGVTGTNVNKCVDILLEELGPEISDAVGINMKFSFNMSKTYQYLKDSVANKQHGSSSTSTRASSGSGCLLPIVAIFVVAFIILNI